MKQEGDRYEENFPDTEDWKSDNWGIEQVRHELWGGLRKVMDTCTEIPSDFLFPFMLIWKLVEKPSFDNFCVTSSNNDLPDLLNWGIYLWGDYAR